MQKQLNGVVVSRNFSREHLVSVLLLCAKDSAGQKKVNIVHTQKLATLTTNKNKAF